MLLAKPLVAFALLLGASALSGTQAAAQAIVTQKPCLGPEGTPCKIFVNTAVPTTINSISFDAPSKGKVAVSITGSMQCSASSATTLERVGDFITQIVTDADTVPDITGPSANKIAFRLGAPALDNLGLSTSFNLATTRVLKVKEGDKTYFFNLRVLRMDSTIQCTIYDAALTIIFIP